ncbi:MAG: glucose-6-phosphate dehydrogenase, partial [Paracoccaceae bacterium]|nr:glucose-6-phosphate dehydrogenase [Paracoccaceae bacterium]
MASRVIPVDPFDLVIFGGTGDLARRKILPALFRRYCAGQMQTGTRLIGAARADMTDAAYRDFVAQALDEFDTAHGHTPEQRAAFLADLHYVTLDAMGDEGWERLAGLMSRDRIKAYYFSDGPGLFGPLAERLHRHG